MTCKCNADSPFLWNTSRVSSFANDPLFKAKTASSKTKSQIMTDVVKKKREDNIVQGTTIYGSTREREAAILRAELFNIFTKKIPK